MLGVPSRQREAQGQFVVLTIAATNLHRETSELSARDFVMLAPDGTVFKPSNDGRDALGSSEPPVMWLIRQVQPSLATTFRVVFDVNPTIKRYTLVAAEIPFSIELP